MVSVTGTAEAPVTPALSTTASNSSFVIRGRAPSCTAISSARGSASKAPAITDSVRVSPPRITFTGFCRAHPLQSSARGTSRSSLVTKIISSVRSDASTARRVCSSTVPSPSGSSSLSFPIRRDWPAATTTVVQKGLAGFRRPRILSSNFPMILPPENTTEKLTF